MTRKSRREIERLLEDLAPSERGERPEPVPADQKAALSEFFDVDPWEENPAVHEALATARERFGGDPT